MPDAFSVARTVYLDALARPADLALVPGVTSVAVAQLVLSQLGRTTHRLADADGNLGDFLASPKGAAVLEDAEIVEAVLYVGIEGRRRPLRVELRPPASLAMDRRDTDHHATVRRFLEARGVVVAPVVRRDDAEQAR